MTTPIFASSLHTYLFERLQTAFGIPDRIRGDDWYWALRSIKGVAINILADAAPSRPVVWVFNAYDRGREFGATSLHNEAEVEHLIVKIQERMCIADRPRTRVLARLGSRSL